MCVCVSLGDGLPPRQGDSTQRHEVQECVLRQRQSCHHRLWTLHHIGGFTGWQVFMVESKEKKIRISHCQQQASELNSRAERWTVLLTLFAISINQPIELKQIE